jgi:hypothetical protein
LRQRSELIQPASAFLASESGHIESEAAEHDLHAFQAVRSMDEILVANFMVSASEPFDLWVGDEAWEIDYFLHENPELKRAPYAWMTDFVGWLPMPDGGPREQALTADYNAEMIEQIARFPALRDRSVFVGNPDAWSRTGSATACPPSATGYNRTTGSPATCPVSNRTSSPTGTPSAPNSATGPASRSAWSPSAAPASARICSAVRSRRTRQLSRCCPVEADGAARAAALLAELI